MKNITNYTSIFINFATFLLCIIIVLTVCIPTLSHFNLIPKLSFLLVKTNSMTPTIQVGSLVITKLQDSYKLGDIVAFTHPNSIASHASKSKILTLQRVTSLERNQEQTTLKTKSDMQAQSQELYQLSQQEIIGKVVLSIPYVGLLLNWLQTTNGILIALVLPVLLYSTHAYRSYRQSTIKNKRKLHIESFDIKGA